MKVLSLLQPWASLCVIRDLKTGKAAKTIETRGWKPSVAVQNQIKKEGFLIHASKKFDAELSNLSEQPPFWDYMQRFWPEDQEYAGFTNIPLGAIIGHVKFHDAITTSTNFGMSTIEKWAGDHWETEEQFGDYSNNRFGWLLSDAKMFEKPIPCKGALNLWDCPEQIFVQIKSQL